MRLIGVGEILWDVIGRDEHLGGAVFNLCAHAARLGHEVCLISAVGSDARGRRALERTGELGVSTRFIQTVPGHATGAVTVTVDSAGQPSYVIHRPAAYDFAALDDAGFEQLAAWRPDWISFGTLFSMHPNARSLLTGVLQRFPQARRFYDINLRKDSFTRDLVVELLAAADVVKLNDAEVEAVESMLGWSAVSLEDFCRNCAARFQCEAVCVTRGAQGCVLLLAGQYEEVAGHPVRVADAVGAGDAFAAALIHAVDAGWSARAAGAFANRLGALVASRRGAVPDWSLRELEEAVT